MTAADNVLDGLGPAVRQQAGALLKQLVEGLLEPAQDVDTLVRPEEGAAWSAAFDLDRASDPRWLAQLVGVQVPGGLTDEQVRDLIRDRPAQKRGTVGALRAGIRAVLVGAKRIELIERAGGNAYQLTVQVYSSEVPDLDAVEAAIAAQKPVGLVVTVQVLSGATYAHMTAVHGPSMADYAADFPTLADARDHLPE